MSKITLSLAACHLIQKSWNMIDFDNRLEMVENPEDEHNTLFYDVMCASFSAMLAALGHTNDSHAVDVFLIESFQNDSEYDNKGHTFIKFRDEAFNDGVDKYLEHLANHPNKS